MDVGKTRKKIGENINKIYAHETVSGEDGRSYNIYPSSVTADRGEFVRDVFISEGALRTLEIGMAWGLSTLFILEALLSNGAEHEAHVVMDPLQSSKFHNAGLKLLRDIGIEDLVEFHQEPSQLVLPKLVAQRRQFDVAFIDGDHRFEGVFVDFFFVHRLLKPGGVVVFDDLWLDAVYLTCRFAESNLGYIALREHPRQMERPQPWYRIQRRKRDIPGRPIIRAYRKPIEEIPRDWNHFVPFFDLAS